MKQISLIATVLFVLLNLSATGQATLNGTIKDRGTQTVLPYVSIGVVGKNVGTVTDGEGDFSLNLDEKYNNDTLKISMIGYKTQVYSVADFRNSILQNSVLTLQAEVQQLEEVVITNRKLKEKILGNTSTSNLAILFASDQLGNELGTRIKLKKSPAYIKEFNTNIIENKYDSIRFRLNFYEVNGGMPGKSILSENIIITCKIKAGKLNVDLSKYDIVVEDDFFVSLEWLENLDKDGVRFSTGVLGSPTIVKLASQDNWAKIGPLSVGFNVTAAY